MSEESPPNAIIIMVDQMKATASHLYSRHGIHTPGLERLAKLGVRYENATTPHPLCVPARVAMWTAQNPHRTGSTVNKTPMPEHMPHAAKWWKEAGYELALLGKNHCFAGQSDYDLFDVWCEIEHYGFKDNLAHYGFKEGAPVAESPKGMAWVEDEEKIASAHTVRNNMPPPEGGVSSYAVTEFEDRHYSTGLLSNQADAYVRQKHDKSYTLWLSLPDPHVPYETPKHFFTEARSQNIEMPPPGPIPGDEMPMRNRILSQIMRWPDEHLDDLKNVVTAYHANILHIDKLINRLIDTLEETNQLDKTIIVFCSDHGDFSGEHQMAAKGGVLYDCLVRIPMIVVAPNQIPQTHVVSSPVSLLDIVPTLFQLQGLSLPDGLDGQVMQPCTGATDQEYGFALYGARGPAFTMEDLNKINPSSGHATLFKTVNFREPEGDRSMIRNAKWKLVHDPMGDLDELYNFESDPYEHTNLAYDPAYADIKQEMMAALYKWRQW